MAVDNYSRALMAYHNTGFMRYGRKPRQPFGERVVRVIAPDLKIGSIMPDAPARYAHVFRRHKAAK